MAKTTRTDNKAAAAGVSGVGAGAAGAGAAAGAAAFDPKAMIRNLQKAATDNAKKDSKKGDLKRLSLDANEASLLDRYVEAKVVGKFFTTEEENTGGPLKAACLAKWADLVWGSKTVPDNPEIVTLRADNGAVKNRGIFQVRAVLRPGHVIPAPDVRGDKEVRDFLFAALTEGTGGLDKGQANRLIDDEVVFETPLVMNVYHLLEGRFVENVWQPATPEQQAVGMKLYNLYQGIEIPALTPEEVAIALGDNGTVVRFRDSAGFMLRMCSYATSAEQLKHILMVVKPDLAISGVKHEENAPATENARLVAAKRILGLD